MNTVPVPHDVDDAIRLYVLATFLEIPVLNNDACCAIYSLSSARPDLNPGGKSPVHMINYVWGNTFEGSMLRKLMVDMLAYNINNTWSPSQWQDSLKTITTPIEFYFELSYEMHKFIEKAYHYLVTSDPCSTAKWQMVYTNHNRQPLYLVQEIKNALRSGGITIPPPTAYLTNYFVSEE